MFPQNNAIKHLKEGCITKVCLGSKAITLMDDLKHNTKGPFYLRRRYSLQAQELADMTNPLPWAEAIKHIKTSIHDFNGIELVLMYFIMNEKGLKHF